MTRTTPLFAIAVAGAATAAAAQEDCAEITLTEMNWASAAVVHATAKFLIEQGYGCPVQTVPSSSVPALVSISETGEPDIATEVWVNATPVYLELSEAGRIVTANDVLADGGIEGWWIPRYLLEDHPELASVEGLVANAELFDNRFFTCPEGWACKNVNENLAANFGLLDAGFELFVPGSGETLASAMAAAVTDGEPWLGYYWSPSVLMGKYDMVAVDMGEYDHETFLCAADADCTAEGLTSWPVGPVKTILTTDFADRNPRVAALMSNLEFTNDQMNAILAWMDAESATAEEGAVHFLNEYREVWPSWLDDEARQRLNRLID